MKLIVTGGLGFIGSNFILQIFEKYPKFKIVNIDAQLTGSNKKNLQSLKNNNNYQFIKSDINNTKVLEKYVPHCDVIINFAAESHVDRSISGPKPFIHSNVLGVYSILESIRKHKKKLIQISTDEVFGSLRKSSAVENDSFNPASPYAASKASAEMLIKSYVATYDLDIIVTRCTNNYGPRQFEEKLIPKIISYALKNKKIPVYGTGKNIRDWIFVNDHCDALQKVLFKGKKGESYNISASNELTNLQIIKKILKKLKKSENLIKFTSDRLGHDYRYSLDSSKIQRKLKWCPKTSLNDGLDSTINWHVEKNSK